MANGVVPVIELLSSDDEAETPVPQPKPVAPPPRARAAAAAGAACAALQTPTTNHTHPQPLVRGCESTAASAGGGASCPVQQRAAGFLATIGVAPEFLDAQHDRCYCSTCYPAAWQDTIGNEGPTPYVVPRGWVRFGLGVPPRAKARRVFEEWSTSFHGVKSVEVLQSVLDCGMLMKAGDKLLDGTHLRSTKCAGRQDKVFYTSPTVRYAGLKFYAEPHPFGNGMSASIVLQCRQKPGSFKAQGETMQFEKKWPGHLAQECQHVALDTVEWKSDINIATIPYGILIRTFAVHEAGASYSSPLDKRKRLADAAAAAAGVGEPRKRQRNGGAAPRASPSPAAPLQVAQAQPNQRLREARLAEAASVCRLLATPDMDAQLAMICCQRMLALACDAESVAAVLAAGGADAVVGAMRAHVGVAEVQEEGCQAVHGLAWLSDGIAAVLAAGGAEAVVGGMQAHVGAAGVQERGCQTLGSLARSVEGRSKVLLAGGAEAVVGAMRAHVGVAKVQEKGCGAAYSLVFSAESRAALLAGGIKQLARDAARNHPAHAGVQRMSAHLLGRLL
jgi:hypothetical protein